MGYFMFGQRRIVDEDGVDWEVYRFAADDTVVDLPWLRGMRMPVPPPQPIRLRFQDDSPDEGVFVDYVAAPVPLVSHLLREAIERAGAANVEFYDVVVEGAEAYEDFPNYSAINVVGAIEVADPARSSGMRAFGLPGADLFDRFVPRADLETGFAIFRMAEQLSTLLVSERIVALCTELGVQTLEFTPLEAYGGDADQAS